MNKTEITKLVEKHIPVKKPGKKIIKRVKKGAKIGISQANGHSAIITGVSYTAMPMNWSEKGLIPLADTEISLVKDVKKEKESLVALLVGKKGTPPKIDEKQGAE